MRRALARAIEGLGRVEPNPMVGAVVVQGDRIVAEGHHARFGGPHAEVVALEQAGSLARGAELFVSLEPCRHHGKTPPCTEAILAAGIRRVVAAVTDPFPEVSGRGLARLREAGLEVAVGVLEEEARRLNAAFFKRQATGLPLVIAKWAMTLDGRLATAAGESRWISCEESRRRVHEVRRIVDAVIVGAGTAVKDTPSLTVRHVEPIPERGQPTRVVLDDRLVMEASKEPAASARQTPVLVFTTCLLASRRSRQASRPVEPAGRGPVGTARDAVEANRQRAEALREVGCEIVTVAKSGEGLDLREVLAELGRRGMSRVLVEGGARVFGSLFAARLADRVMVFISPRILSKRSEDPYGADADAPGPVVPPAAIVFPSPLAGEGGVRGNRSTTPATPCGPPPGATGGLSERSADPYGSERSADPYGSASAFLPDALDLQDVTVEQVGTDLLIQGRAGDF